MVKVVSSLDLYACHIKSPDANIRDWFYIKRRLRNKYCVPRVDFVRVDYMFLEVY